MAYGLPLMDSIKSSNIICDSVSVKTQKKILKFSQHCLTSRYLKFQLNRGNGIKIVALDSYVSEKIDLYSNDTENDIFCLLNNGRRFCQNIAHYKHTYVIPLLGLQKQNKLSIAR